MHAVPPRRRGRPDAGLSRRAGGHNAAQPFKITGDTPDESTARRVLYGGIARPDRSDCAARTDRMAGRQADHDDRAVPARRRGRYGGAPGGRIAVARTEDRRWWSRTAPAPAAPSASASAARAPADGYTVLLSLSSISILPEADTHPRAQAGLHAEPVQADRPLHRRPDGAGRARRRAVEDLRRIRRRREARSPAPTTTAARATTARCTCRWRC